MLTTAIPDNGLQL